MDIQVLLQKDDDPVARAARYMTDGLPVGQTEVRSLIELHKPVALYEAVAKADSLLKFGRK